MDKACNRMEIDATKLQSDNAPALKSFCEHTFFRAIVSYHPRAA
jgi:hypothetical protein